MEYKIKNIFFKTIDSTQTYAKKNYLKFDPKIITCISSDIQTNGRGRFLKKWFSSFGNIFSTYYFSLPKNTKDISSIGIVLSLSIIKIFHQKNINAKIKWPNDILINKKKLCGILCEIFSNKDLYHIFLGTGINVNMDDKDLIKIKNSATSLKKETNKIWDKNQLLIEIQKQFLKDLKEFRKNGFIHFLPFFKKNLLFQNEKIEISINKKKYIGILHSITPSGGIILLQNKNKKTFYSGTIKKL